MASGRERSTRFGIEWTFFAEGKAGKTAISNTYYYLQHYYFFFLLPLSRGESPLLPGWAGQKKSRVWQDMC
jgi:hypothetical protein